MRTLAVFIACALSGCATLNIIDTSVEKTGATPKIGESATAPVGGVVYSEFKYQSRVAYKIQNNYSGGLGLGQISVAKGDLLVKADLSGEVVYCTLSLAYVDPLVGPFRTACFIDTNNDGEFEKAKAAPGSVWFETEIAPSLAYDESEQVLPQSDSFKYELLYQGISKNALKLLYREYLNDFARPAFYQDVIYDLESKPTTITFRTVRIEVINADNSRIAYRVLSGF